MADQPLGQLLDTLGVTFDLTDDQLVPSAVVLLKVIDTDGKVSVGIASSEGLSWLDQLALVTAADDIVRQGGYDQIDDD